MKLRSRLINTFMGILLLSTGFGLTIDNAQLYLRNEEWTFSLAGIMVGLGIGLYLVGDLQKNSLLNAKKLFFLIPLTFALSGWMAGGTVDEFLTKEEVYIATLGMFFTGIFAALSVTLKVYAAQKLSVKPEEVKA